MRKLSLPLICILLFNCCEKEYIPDLEITKGIFIDERDGHEYQTVTILSQTWMAENLAFLPFVNPSEMGSDIEPFHYVYSYEGNVIDEAISTEYYQLFGVMYNWDAAISACPSGWHLPTDDEWTLLSNNLISNGFGNAGGGDDIGKSMASTSAWSQSRVFGAIGNDLEENNKSGLNFLPGGQLPVNGVWAAKNQEAYFWTSTLTSDYSPTAYNRTLKYSDREIYRSWASQLAAYSVRCVKDKE